MVKILFIVLFALVSHAAWATEADVYCLTGTKSDGTSPAWAPASTTTPCPMNTAATPGLVPVSTAVAKTSLVISTTDNSKLFSAYATGLSGGTTASFIIYNAVAAPSPGALTPALVLDCVPFNSLGEALVNYGGLPSLKATIGLVALVSSADCTTPTYTTGVVTAGFIKAMYQ